MQKIIKVTTDALAKREPTDDEVAEAVVEALVMVGSVVDSLKTIAEAAMKLAGAVSNNEFDINIARDQRG